MSRSEFDIIYQHLAASAAAFSTEGVALGIGDDAAQIRVTDSEKGGLINVSMDVLVGDVHFPADAAPELIANRALAVNLSDLAAMGAKPLGFTLGLTLPDGDEQWLEKFSAGLAPLAIKHQCPLIGGDLSRGPLNIAIQVHGSTASEGLRRGAAQIGDAILVSGALGDGVAALASFDLPTHLDKVLNFATDDLGDEDRQYLEQAFYAPEPRVELGQACLGLASACIDLSDGLLADLGHICKASSVGAAIELDRLPVSAALKKMLEDDEASLAALLGGDDYELCLTVPPSQVSAIETAAVSLGIEVTRIGVIEKQDGLRCLNASGEEIAVPATAYEHFGSA